jgi:ethanolamine permease
MAVFGAVISYFMQMLSFVLLRRKMPNIERPYRSPMGEMGAMIAAAIALISMFSLFLTEAYRPGVYGAAVWFAIGLIYFAVSGRHKLVLSPEEEFAMSMGGRGHPEKGDFGGDSVEAGQTEPTSPAG